MRCRLRLLLLLPLALGACATRPVHAGEILMTAYSATGTATATVTGPASASVDGTNFTGTRDLSQPPSSTPRDSFSSSLGGRAGTPGSSVVTSPYSVDASITNRTLKFGFEWVRDTVLVNGVPTPDPTDLPPVELAVVMQFNLTGSVELGAIGIFNPSTGTTTFPEASASGTVSVDDFTLPMPAAHCGGTDAPDSFSDSASHEKLYTLPFAVGRAELLSGRRPAWRSLE